MIFKSIFRNRRRKVISILMDIATITFIYSFLLGTEITLSNKIFFVLLNSFLWIIISYIVGRYYTNISQRNIASLNKFAFFIIKHIGRTLLSLFIFVLVSKSFINIFITDNVLKTNFYIITSIFCLFSIFSQLLIYKYFAAKFLKSNNWLFLGNKENYNNLRKNLSLNSDIDLSISLIENLNNYKSNSNIYGLIIDSNETALLYSKSFQDQALFEEIIVLKKWYEIYLQQIPSQLITGTEIINGEFNIKTERLMIHLKRMFDIIFSLILLIVTFPLLIVISMLIFFEDKGTILYAQKRTGLNGKVFKLLKLRSMSINAENGGAKWSTKNDPRVTKIGKFIRRVRIDELPQLISVIKGDMSLIGPRPERPEFNISLSEKIDNYELRHTIRPGLSGWAQVNYPYGASLEDAKQKLSYDLYYLKNYSILIDILIFFRTIKLVLNVRGSEPIS